MITSPALDCMNKRKSLSTKANPLDRVILQSFLGHLLLEFISIMRIYLLLQFIICVAIADDDPEITIVKKGDRTEMNCAAEATKEIEFCCTIHLLVFKNMFFRKC